MANGTVISKTGTLTTVVGSSGRTTITGKGIQYRIDGYLEPWTLDFEVFAQ